MAAAFKIGEGYVEITSRVDQDRITKDAGSTGESFEKKFTEASTKSVRKSAPKFSKAVKDAIEPGSQGNGRSMGSKLVSGIGTAVMSLAGPKITGPMFSTLSEGLSGFAKSPIGLAAIGAMVASAGTLVASGLAATISAGLVLGLGVGGIGLAAFLLKDNKEIRSQFSKTAKKVKSEFTGLADVMIKPFTKAIPILGQAVESLVPVVDVLFRSLAPAIVPLANGLGQAIANMTPGLTALAERTGPFLISLASKLPAMGTSISGFFQSIADNWPKIQAGFYQFMGTVGDILGALSTAFLWLAANYDTIMTLFKISIAPIMAVVAAVKLVTAVFSWFRDTLPGIVAGAWVSIVGFFTGIWTTITGWWASFLGWMGGARASLSGWVASVAAFFAALPGRIGSFLASLPGVIMQWIRSAMTQMLYQTGYSIGATIKLFMDLPGHVRSALVGLWGAMSGAFTTAKNNAISYTSQLVSSVRSWIAGLPGKARAAISSLWSSMSGAFKSSQAGASAGANALVSKTVSYLRTLPGKARSAIASLPGRIKSVFSGAGGWLVSAGANILRGLVNGMRGAVGAAVNAAVGAARSVINGLKRGLGIGSPSKVADREVGRWVMPGVTQGVKRSLPDELKKIKAMAPQVAVSAVAGAASRSATSGSALAPVETPTRSSGPQIGELNIYLKGILDPSDPTAKRRLSKELYDLVNAYQRSYA